MKQIFGQDALQLQPCQTGFIFVLKQEEREQKAVVSYKMMDFERMTFTPVTRNVYLLSKFGNLFEQFDGNPDEFLNVRSVFLPDHRLLTVDAQGNATVYALDGKKEQTFAMTFEGCPPDSLVAGETCIYASFPDACAVVRYHGESLRPEMRIGGKGGPIPRPEGLFYEHGQLLICMPTEQKIMRLDQTVFEFFEYYSFDQPVHRYAKYHANEIVFLDSGVYKL